MIGLPPRGGPGDQSIRLCRGSVFGGYQAGRQFCGGGPYRDQQVHGSYSDSAEMQLGFLDFEQELDFVFMDSNSALPENYPPLSLREAFCKLHAQLTLNRIQKPVDGKLERTQHGFRAGRSTSDPIHILRSVQDLFMQNGSPHFFSIDWKQAFDKVDHAALYASLIQIGGPTRLVAASQSMYTAPLFTCQKADTTPPHLQLTRASDKAAPLVQSY